MQFSYLSRPCVLATSKVTELRDPLWVMLLFTVNVVLSRSHPQAPLHQVSPAASAKHNASSLSTCCVANIESHGITWILLKEESKQAHCDRTLHVWMFLLSYFTHCAYIWGWEVTSNVFYTIPTVLALKGNRAKSRLAEVTHCMKGME